MGKKKKNPFKYHEVEEVLAVESTYYVIELNNDFFEHNEKMAFTKSVATDHYNKILKELYDMYDNGTPHQRLLIAHGIESLKISPLRIQ